MDSIINHYYVENVYFTLYMEAYQYCEKNNINPLKIDKTKTYK